MVPVTNSAKSKMLVKMDRKQLSSCIELITGHNRLRYHESRMSNEVSPLCREGCKVDETSWHIVCECPAFWKLRAEVFNTYHEISAPLEWSVKQLMTLVRNPQVIKLLQGEQEDPGLP